MTAMTSEELGISSPAEKVAAARRRDATKRVRWVRDKLTSTSGTPAFDYELLRQFAQNRQSASMAILLLIATVGFLSGLWTGLLLAGTWTLAVAGVHTIVIGPAARDVCRDRPGNNRGRARLCAARRHAQFHPRRDDSHGAGLFHHAGAAALFDHTRDP